MSDIIQLLPDHVANQIAAGEVVQRPASVVKELLENAIDAKATTIKLIIKEAGKTLIQVIDNGIGMSITDARLSFERHATSKIKTATDLFNLHTKGFRGEALASIAAIAHVELKTKREQDTLGTKLIIKGSEVVSQDVCTTPTGASIAVKNLFFNVPARRNFLKSNPVETRHIMDEFHRVALAHPNINFSMYNNENEVFNLPQSNYRQRIVNVFGSKTNERLVPVEETTEILKIYGFVGKPEFAKRTRGEQFFFVNNRFIKSAYLNHAVNNAFEGLLKEGTHASYFINLMVDPKTIDINIHPTKTEIKFTDEQTLYALLRSAVKHSLGQFNVAPVLDFNRESSMDTPYNYKHKEATIPVVEVDRTFNPFKDEVVSEAASYKQKKTASWESLYTSLNIEDNDAQTLELESSSTQEALFKTETVVSKTFQLHNKYIVSSIKSGLLIIDQYRAHQRVLYEQMLQNVTLNNVVSQELLFPKTIEFSKSNFEILKTIKSDIEQNGFLFSSFKNNMVSLKAIPSNVNEVNIETIFEQFIETLKQETPNTNFSTTDTLIKAVAKQSAIKTGQTLNVKEQEHLVNSLFACKEPKLSPNNAPTFITLTLDALANKF